MKKGPDFRIFAAITGVILLAGAGVMYSQASTLSDEQSKEAALRAELKNDRELKDLLLQSMTKLKSTREQLAHLEKGVPDYAYLATMLKDLEKTGRESGVTILGVAQKPRTSAPTDASGGHAERKPYIEQDIEVVGKGKYEDAIHFVQALNKFPKVVAARTVILQPKLTLHEERSLDITIALRTYLFPEKAKAVSKDSAQLRKGVKNDG